MISIHIRLVTAGYFFLLEYIVFNKTLPKIQIEISTVYAAKDLVKNGKAV